MDLFKLSAAQTGSKAVSMPVRHPATLLPMIDETTKEPITISLVGKDSAEYTSAFRSISDDRLDNSVNQGTRPRLNTAQMEHEGIKLLAAVTKGWSHIRKGDAEHPFSEPNAVELYQSLPWLKEQVDAFVNNRANFLGNL